MNAIRSIGSILSNEEVQNHAVKTAGMTSLAAVCAYGGTFFFTAHNPIIGVVYLSSAALTSHVAYQIFEKMKESVESERLKYVITAVQLFQIPVVCYLAPGTLLPQLSNAIKLEIIIATAHFVAIPVFFHIAIKAWENRDFAFAVSIMLSLANGLRTYIP